MCCLFSRFLTGKRSGSPYGKRFGYQSNTSTTMKKSTTTTRSNNKKNLKDGTRNKCPIPHLCFWTLNVWNHPPRVVPEICMPVFIFLRMLLLEGAAIHSSFLAVLMFISFWRAFEWTGLMFRVPKSPETLGEKRKLPFHDHFLTVWMLICKYFVTKTLFHLCL